MKGYCYLIAEHLTLRYKIGRAVAPTKRLKQLQTGNSKRLGLVCTIKTGDAVALERSLLSQYQHRKIAGEWFALTYEDVADIKSLPGAW